MTTAVIAATSGWTSRVMLPAGSALTCLGNLPEPPLVEQHKVPAWFGAYQVLVGETRDGADGGFESRAGEVGQVLA